MKRQEQTKVLQSKVRREENLLIRRVAESGGKEEGKKREKQTYFTFLKQIRQKRHYYGVIHRERQYLTSYITM